MKKIIIIYENVFLERDFKRFEIDFYLKKNLKIEIWDISKFILKNISIPKSDFINSYQNLKIINFLDKNSFKKLAKQINKETFVMTSLSLNTKSEWIFLELEKNFITWGYFRLSYYPINKLSFMGIIRTIILNQKILIEKLEMIKKRSVNFFLFKNKVNKISPKFIIYAGNNAKKNISFDVHSDSLKISAHSFAYNEFLLNKNSNTESNDLLRKQFKKKYILYIDEDVPNHKDPYYHGFKKNLCEKNIFYKEICNFFDYLENKYNCEVVIAVYPKAQYSIEDNPYGRKAFKNKTLELIKNSFFVIQHNSTAVNFSVIYNKPLIFMTSQNYLFNYRASIEDLATELGTKSVNLSSKKDNYYDLNISIKYKNYINYFKNYISDNSDDAQITSAQIIYEKLVNF